MTVLFLGVGNLHRADDGVGPYLAERLAADPAFAQNGIEVLPHSGEGASLIHLWEGAKKVVIVDAMKSGLKVGEVRRFDAVKETLHYGVFRYSSHLFSLAEAVEMSRALDSLPQEMIVYGIEG
ncbi:MAG: hydrogenase maturation protease, partial [Bdellovibrionales bacterium]